MKSTVSRIFLIVLGEGTVHSDKSTVSKIQSSIRIHAKSFSKTYFLLSIYREVNQSVCQLISAVYEDMIFHTKKSDIFSFYASSAHTC